MLFVNLLAIIDFVKMKSYNKNIEKDFDKIKADFAVEWRKVMKKVLSILLALVLCFSLAVCFTGCKKEDVASTPSEVEVVKFEAPTDYASVVQVKINPTVNLYLDKDGNIIAVEYVNKDAKDTYEAIENNLIGASFEVAMDLVVEKAEEKGFLADNKEISIDVIENKLEEVKETEILRTAQKTVKQVLDEKKIEITINIYIGGKDAAAEVKAEDDKAAADKAAADKAAADKAAADKAAADKAAADKAAADKAAADKAAAEKAAKEKELKNPKKNLKMSVKYRKYLVKDWDPEFEGDELQVVTMSFANGEMGLGISTYTLNTEFSDPNYTIVYGGKTWYELGGRGGGGIYTLTDEAINLDDTGGGTATLTMTTDGKLVVASNNGFFSDGEAKVGDVFAIS